jgi:DNA-binding NarL/FixJ family response regulator
MALRCLIVDDSAGFREAARALLEQEGVTVVGVASTGNEALARTGELHRAAELEVIPSWRWRLAVFSAGEWIAYW